MNSRSIHFDGCVLTYEPRWGDELPEADHPDVGPDWEGNADTPPRIGFVGRIALGIAIAFLRQAIFSTETKVDRSSLADFSQRMSEGSQSARQAADREFCQR